jgi:hypothetical protein
VVTMRPPRQILNRGEGKEQGRSLVIQLSQIMGDVLESKDSLVVQR